MRASLAEPSADRMSSSVTWCAWGLAGAFFTLVALPLASSSPYPTPSRPEWSEAPAQMAMASASGFSLASASSTQVPGETVQLVTTVKTLSIRRPIGDAPEADAPIVTASLGKYQAREPGYEQQMAVAPSMDDAAPIEAPAPASPRTRATPDQVSVYLWEVYQRQPVKKDRGG